MNDNWDDYRFLLAVHKAGTMTAAARLLNTNVATVSRRIDRLADQLGYPPFVKSAVGWTANAQVAPLLESIEIFDATLKNERNRTILDQPENRAPIRIGAPPVVCSQVLFPSLGQAGALTESVSLEFHDRFHGEGLGDFDVVIQASRPETGRVITRRIGHMEFALWAPADAAPNPQDWVGLTRDYDAYPAIQLGFRAFGREPLVRTHHFDQLHQIILSTGLPGPLPSTFAQSGPPLVEIDTGVPRHETEFWVLYHATRKGDPLLRMVTDWIEECFRDRAAPA